LLLPLFLRHDFSRLCPYHCQAWQFHALTSLRILSQERCLRLLALSDDDGSDDDDDLIIAYAYRLHTRRIYVHSKVDLHCLTSSQARQLFRFTIDELDLILHHLAWPPYLKIGNGKHAFSIETLEALAMLLRRLVSRDPPVSIAQLFQRSRSTVSRVLRVVLKLLSPKVNSCLSWYPNLAQRVQLYNASIETMCPLLLRCVGFLDGTRVEICRPIRHQQSAYCGYKHMHCLIFQGVMAPDGLFIHAFGPVTGRHHDVYAYNRSNLKSRLIAINSAVVADSGYPVTTQLRSRVKFPMTAEHDELNLQISKSRICVEWGYGRVKSLFPYLQTRDQLRSLQIPVGTFFMLGFFISNVRTCIDCRNIVSDYFECLPPTLEEYLHE
jgi:nuclease HARBI1